MKISKVKKTFKKTWKNPKSRLFVFVVGFALIGIVLLLSTRAASFSISVEPENGTLAGSASTTTDSTASGSKAVRFGTTSSNGVYSDSNPPWMLKAGESLTDNVPSSVTIKNYVDFSNNGARSFTQTMDEIRTKANAPYYVRMPAGTFHISNFSYGSSNAGYGAGYQDVNGTKYFGGIIGAGADKTFIVVDPNSLSSAQVASVASGNPSPVQMKAIYAGSGNLPIPTVFSGITFRGNFQQTTTLSKLDGTAPAPYEGLYLTSTKPGSVIQYSRFQGFGFAAKASPPYEMGSINSVRSNYSIRRVEFDGRLAKEINSAQPVASGGVMWNYEVDVKVIDSWLHHTRRSGWATHDHAPSEGGNGSDNGAYYGENFQVENIANTSDGLAGTELGFPTANIEEVRNTMTFVKPRFKLNSATPTPINAHVVIGHSYGNPMARSISIADPVITDTTKGGCLIIRIIKQPNNYGINPYYTAYQNGGFAAMPIKVTRNGGSLTPVLIGNYNASIHTPDKYYVVIMG